jgi:hypothetical protein
MRAPHFVRLARIDDQRFINGCRHGIVHLTWGRNTIRFSREEFRRVANLLEHAVSALPPYSLRDGDFGVTYRSDDECELRLGHVVMLLSCHEFEELANAAREAVDRLDQILASGAWDRADPEESETGFLDRLYRNPFSPN